jgi:DNA-binding NtrC family response regulator
MFGPVLAIDDDRDVLHAVRVALSGRSTHIETSEAPDVLPAILQSEVYDVVLLDMNFERGDQSGRSGLSLLAQIHDLDANLSVVMMTAFGGVSLAVDALKRGAVDFVLKPWRNDKLVEVVGAAAELTKTRRAAQQGFDLQSAERDAIQRALAHHGGNLSRAAASLGLTRPALYRRLAKHGL